MQLFKLKIPRMEFIVFELLEVDKNKLSNSTYKPESVFAVDLAVLPENLQYRVQSRDAIVQTQSSVYVQRYDFTPERVTLSGTFGDDIRFIRNSWLDGWSRLKMFEDELVKRSKTNSGNKYYVINYYDFQFQRFGVINIDSWSLSGNARDNTNLVRYQLDFTIVDGLYQANNWNSNIYNYLAMSLIERTINMGYTNNNTGFDFQSLGLEVASGLKEIVDTVVGFMNNTPLGGIVKKITLKSGAF
jgi:hypothetical protein